MPHETQPDSGPELSEQLRVAVDYALLEASEGLAAGCGLVPFTVTRIAGCYDVTDHPVGSAEAVYASVRSLVSRDAPDLYAFVYDGSLETGGAGSGRALICEAAEREDARAHLIALRYRPDGGSVRFADRPISVGWAESLFSPAERVDAVTGPGAAAPGIEGPVSPGPGVDLALRPAPSSGVDLGRCPAPPPGAARVPLGVPSLFPLAFSALAGLVAGAPTVF